MEQDSKPAGLDRDYPGAVPVLRSVPMASYFLILGSILFLNCPNLFSHLVAMPAFIFGPLDLISSPQQSGSVLAMRSLIERHSGL